MALPGFRKRRAAAASNRENVKDASVSNGNLVTKRATRARRHAVFVASFCYFVAFVFLILVEIGNTKGTTVLGDIYFFRLDLADILPGSVSGLSSLTLTNSIARTLGLHDFYQVGLWNFCEGYDTDGITSCSKPQSLYWFNPVEILTNELLAGATIALPSEVNSILNILRIASQVMFGCFIASCVLDFFLMLTGPIVLFSRWWSFPMSILSLLSMVMTLGATAVATAMSLIFKYALTSQSELNVKVYIGVKMWSFMWIATGFSLIAFCIHAGMCCCCTSRRDIKTGRKGGKILALSHDSSEKPGYKLPVFAKKSQTSV